MAKPSQLPRWATGAGAKVTPEPTEGKKDLGWVAAEKPPESYENWARKLIYQWCQYLDGLFGEAITWTAQHIFAADVTMQQTLSVTGTVSCADPTAAGHADTKGARDTAITTGVANHNAVVNPHSATSAATASRLALRDANGRAAFADPAAAGDAATKGYTDAGNCLVAARVASDGSILAQKGSITLGAFTKTSAGEYWVTVSGMTGNGIVIGSGADAGTFMAKPAVGANILYMSTRTSSGVAADGSFAVVIYRL